jgi:membrane protein YqaA with SNARE-associated domain
LRTLASPLLATPTPARNLSLPCFELPHPTDVHSVLRHFLAWLLHLGVFGPLLLGIADSSFLFLPFGNDLLIVILTARDHAHLPFYILTAAIGSTLGVLLLDAVCRKGGEEGLKKMMKPRRLDYFKRRMTNQAAVAIVLACLAPPPFPFTLVIASASAFAYPRRRLFGLVFVARAVRFTILGLLAIRFGSDILRIASAPETTWIMVGFIALCVIGSAFQVMQWIRRSRRLA